MTPFGVFFYIRNICGRMSILVINAAMPKKGMLDIYMQAERRNLTKVLMLFDVGSSMDIHIKALEKLFSAAKKEFKTLEFFYFHYCLYDYVWKGNDHCYSAPMSSYELITTSGSVEDMTNYIAW